MHQGFSMATIIRKDSAAATPAKHAGQPVAFSFADMRGQANDYMETVRTEAAKIIQQAHSQAEQIRRQAEAAGRKAAEAEAERAIDEKIGKRMNTLVPALEQLVQQIYDAKGELLAQWERSALHVVSAIAERVVRRRLEKEPEIALEIIADALQLTVGSAEITLRVNPTDYENFGPQIDRLAATICRLAPSQIVSDPALSPGGCRVVTKFGEIDERIEAQLQRIEQDLE
jgi:flagellar biosynthesis/type III secretory pathway protein FliH